MSRLYDILNNKAGNYIFPFFWQSGDHTEHLVDQLRRIYSTGIRAVTVESRGHEDYCGETWWRDMDIILAEAEALGMEVWILDDCRYPTGVANWAIRDKYPHLRPWRMIERHVDLRGPVKNCSLIRLPDTEDEQLLAVYAYRRSGVGEDLCGEPFRIDHTRDDNFVYFDLPEGLWRVFFYSRSRRGTDKGLPYFVDMISEESVNVLIEAVYQPHFDKYKRYFGKTIVGFFSDEPCLANDMVEPWTVNYGMYNRVLGTVGLALPWSDELYGRMSAALGRDAMPYLAALWYQLDGDGDTDAKTVTTDTRCSYMDAVTSLWSDNFQRPLRIWCHDHGVEHIGHIIEDMNAHARLGCSGGHYFRSLQEQDMSGIDIVMQQVMPQFEYLPHTTTAWSNVADPEFFRYVLAKLASSLAHLTPHMAGRAMCETFGAYGWAEGVPMMKWLADFLMVRGINRFVPHAFAPKFPFQDAPPYFGVNGIDPQFEAFSVLMDYMNKTTHLLADTRHIADAAILYHAEGEWMCGFDAMLTQVPARYLGDAQIDYDIVSADMLLGAAQIEDGALVIAGERFRVLVIPYAPHLPTELIDRLGEFAADGLKIIFAGDRLPGGCEGHLCCAPEDIPAVVRKCGLAEIIPSCYVPQLKIYHCVRDEDGSEYYMIRNESVLEKISVELSLPSRGEGILVDVLGGENVPVCLCSGKLAIELEPYQTRILVLGADSAQIAEGEFAPVLAAPTEESKIAAPWKISLACCESMDKFEDYIETDVLPNITSPEHKPRFGGLIRYEGKLDLGQGARVLDLGEVGHTARLSVNGIDCGMKICPPYRFDISAAARDGVNDITVTVANTLVQYDPDSFSRCMTIPPSGMMGTIRHGR